ncbi:MAG: thioredoxin domain-containing protein [Nitrospirae bacterium]|nr:thioredoxin domain-containing protein [Nitrospirota bacterium]
MTAARFFMVMFFLVATPFYINAAAAEEPDIRGEYITVPPFKFIFDGQQVEVMEFFSFYCGHCYQFEKSIAVIKGNFPKKIKWRYMPVYWGKGSSKPGEAYMIAEEMGKGEQMKKALFEAAFLEKRDIGDLTVLESLGDRLGLGFDFSRKLRGGEKAREANALLIMLETYKIEETPSIIIAGNIKVTPHMTNDSMELFRENIITIIKSILNR